MSHTTSPSPATTSPPSPGKPVAFTLIAATVAATAAFLALAAGLPVWAMFVGWVTWFLRPTSIRDGLFSMACLWAGLLLAIAAHLATGALALVAGTAALPITVFAVGLIVVGLHRAPVLGNPLAWFLGLISTFALHAPEPLPGLLTLVAATAVGAAAGLLCQRLQRRFAHWTATGQPPNRPCAGSHLCSRSWAHRSTCRATGAAGARTTSSARST